MLLGWMGFEKEEEGAGKERGLVMHAAFLNGSRTASCLSIYHQLESIEQMLGVFEREGGDGKRAWGRDVHAASLNGSRTRQAGCLPSSHITRDDRKRDLDLFEISRWHRQKRELAAGVSRKTTGIPPRLARQRTNQNSTQRKRGTIRNIDPASRLLDHHVSHLPSCFQSRFL